MAERIEIRFEATDAMSGVLRGILGQFGQMGNLIGSLTEENVRWGNVAADATSIVINGLKDAIKQTVNYAAEVQKLAAISGSTTEEASRFLQVLDDYGLSAKDAEAATRTLTKNGLAPTTETLAALSDQYLALNTIQEKNAFILENLGTAGLEWVNVLGMGSTAIREQSAAVADSLVLTQEGVQQARDYALAVDGLDDSFMALKVSLGSSIIPGLSTLLNWITKNIGAIQALASAIYNLSSVGLGQNIGLALAGQGGYKGGSLYVPPGSGKGGGGTSTGGLVISTANMPSGFRQHGGQVSAGGSYIVGERGPEIFRPNESGRIEANGSMGGGSVYNIVINNPEPEAAEYSIAQELKKLSYLGVMR